jgi:hypothetical protein
MNIKIAYLHGLESKQGGDKVAFLNDLGEVFAPQMLYMEHPKYLFKDMLQKMVGFKPDLIIGSSMGGLFAESIATHINTTLLLFNPATINTAKYLSELGIAVFLGKEEKTGNVVLGEKDDVVDPVESELYYNKMNLNVYKESHGHRTPLVVFKKHVNLTISKM